MEDDDPLAESRKWKEEIWEEAGGTVESYLRSVMERQKDYEGRLVQRGSGIPPPPDEPTS